MIKVTDGKTPQVSDNTILIQEPLNSTPTPSGQLKKGAYYSFGGAWRNFVDLLTPYLTLLYVPLSRKITINGDTKDLTSDRSWTVSGNAVWGGITGTLSDQTDLQNALNAKEDAANKATTVTGNQTSNIKFPTVKALVDWVTLQLNNYVTLTTDQTITGIKTIANYLDFSHIATPTHQRGRIYFDNLNDCIAYMDSISTTSVQVGYEVLMRARNNTGSMIPNGSAVYISGAIGQNPTVALAQANTVGSAKLIGLATHDIAINTVGKIVVFGIANDLNTNSFSDGDILYLSASVAGGLTTTPPASPNFVTRVGVVEHAHSTQGKILVNTGATLANDNALGTIQIAPPTQNAVKSYVDTGLAAKQNTITTGTTLQYLRGDLSLSTFATDAKSSVGHYVVAKTFTGTTVSGTAAETLTMSVQIPANSFQSNDVTEIYFSGRKSGTNNTGQIRAYINTSNTLSGATLIGTGAALVAATRTTNFQRIYGNFTTSTNYNVAAVGTANNSDNVNVSANESNITWDTTQTYWLIISIQLTSTSDSFIPKFLMVKNNR